LKPVILEAVVAAPSRRSMGDLLKFIDIGEDGWSRRRFSFHARKTQSHNCDTCALLNRHATF
jgi:hypothetical protein